MLYCNAGFGRRGLGPTHFHRLWPAEQVRGLVSPCMRCARQWPVKSADAGLFGPRLSPSPCVLPRRLGRRSRRCCGTAAWCGCGTSRTDSSKCPRRCCTCTCSCQASVVVCCRLPLWSAPADPLVVPALLRKDGAQALLIAGQLSRRASTCCLQQQHPAVEQPQQSAAAARGRDTGR